MPTPKPPTSTRFCDRPEVKEKLQRLEHKLLELLETKVDAHTIEPPELKLLWDIIKTHGIGFESVDEIVQKSIQASDNSLTEEDMALPTDWDFVRD